MMCEECGKNPAVFHFVTIFEDDTSERNLCAECMARYRKKLPGFNIQNLAGILNNLLGDVIKEKEEEPDPEVDEMTCDQCGMTYREFKKGGMLGCSDCYRVFSKPLTSVLQRMHGNTQHAGRVPGGVHRSTTIKMNIERLKLKLKKAIESEEYEEAAKYRDAIRSLNAQLESKERTVHVPPRSVIEGESTSEGGEWNECPGIRS